MNLPINVFYRCMGCRKKMTLDEHARNLTIEDVPMDDGFKHTMTVIVCDTCKPEYDRLRADNEDALTTVQELELNAVQGALPPITEAEGSMG